MKKKNPHDKASNEPQVLPQEAARLLVARILAAARRQEKGIAQKLFQNDREAVSMLAWLAEAPDNMLAAELAGPAMALVETIGHFAMQAEAIAIAARKLKREDWQKTAEKALDSLHFALASVFRNLRSMVSVHACFSKNPDLLCEALGDAIGDGQEAAKLLEHYAKVRPEEFRTEDGRAEPESWPDAFAWDAYLRLTALDDMADRFPAHVKTAARFMNAWPMLRHRHTDSKARFEALAEKLDLGAAYPLDTTKAAKFRPDTPMVRYLDGLVWRLHNFRLNMAWARKRGEDEAEAIARMWQEPGEPKIDETIQTVLRVAQDLKPLTKRTAPAWAKRLIVPYIMAADAKTADTCEVPALKAIWNQRGKTGKLKSRSDFKSRLTPDVVKTLRSMARPD